MGGRRRLRGHSVGGAGAPSFVLAVALAAVACSDDAPATDAGPSDAGDAGADARGDADATPPDAGPLVPPPDPAALPRMTPCPDGWREVDLGGLAGCRPWPSDTPPSCPAGEAWFPGETECNPVGDRCPDGEFPDDVPDGAVYVAADATGGDGSRGAPFGTLREAADAAPDGGVVIIGKGRYEQTIELDRPLTLHGACARETVLVGVPREAEHPWIIMGVATDVTVRNLRLEQGPLGAINLRGGSLRVHGVISDGAGLETLSFGSADVQGSEIVIREAAGDGLAASDSTVSLDRILMDGVTGTGIRGSGAEVTLTNAVLLRVSSGGIGLGLMHCQDRSTCALEAAWVAGGQSIEIGAINDSRIALTDVTILGPESGRDVANGIQALFDTTLRARRVLIENATEAAIFGGTPAVALDLADVLVRDVHPSAEVSVGRAVAVEEGAHLEASRLLVERATETAILMSNAPATVTDLTVRGTRSNAMGFWGRALQVQLGSVVEIDRFLAEDNREIAVVAAALGTELTLRNTAIRNTRRRACVEDACAGFGAGTGVGSYQDALLDMERFLVTGHPLAGVQIAREGEMDLRDGEVSDNAIGANVQVPGYDVTRLSNRVIYRRNGRNLDFDMLPVPEL